MASNAPASLLFLSTRSSSAGVSVVNELTAITTGTPNMCTFSMCFCRLANPASNRVRFSCGGEREGEGRGGKERKEGRGKEGDREEESNNRGELGEGDGEKGRGKGEGKERQRKKCGRC